MTGPAIDLFPLSLFATTASEARLCPYRSARMPTLVWQYGTSGRFLIAQSDRGPASLDREQLIKTHRVSDPDNVTGGIVVEPKGDVKIHLLIWSEAIQSAPIQQVDFHVALGLN